MKEECCNHNCNQGRDCPLRNKGTRKMTANELADYLEVSPNMTVFKAAAVLRQQAKELVEAGGMIGVLREYISDLENGLDSSIKLNKAQAERRAKETLKVQEK